VEDLLLLAKADENGLRLAVTDVDLDYLVDAEARRLRGATALRVEVTASAVRVAGDPVKLAQAIRNLTDNAARHAHRTIGLHVIADGAAAVVQVDDDGPGIPDGERERVFDRFVRLDSSRERASGGSGLGLAIVRTVVGAHAGSVAAEVSPWGGARFTVRLPRAGRPSRAPA
jgi:signal transduction histidine kinase